MNKFQKLLFGFVGGVALGALLPWRTAHAIGDTTLFDTAKQISVATTTASPTLILSSIYSSADVALMLNWSGSGTFPNNEYLLLDSKNTNFTSTGTLKIPAGQRPSDYLYLNNYRGPLYGVVVGTTSAQTVFVLRKK